MGNRRCSMHEEIRQRLHRKAKKLLGKSGCYLMKGGGKILYVGKAKNLRTRVSSYFQSSSKGAKTEVLLSQVEDFDFQFTLGEAEALILESNLIKKYTPKYNILMKDDKSYPYVLVDRREPFPRMVYQRRPQRREGVDIYGPFVHGSKISEALRIIVKSFRLRDCTLQEFNSRKEPCLLYQIKQCSAPCVGKISEQDYRADLEAALGMFRGEGTTSMNILKAKMNACARAEEFEQAAIIRDYLDVLSEFIRLRGESGGTGGKGQSSLDVLAWSCRNSEVDVTVYMVRNSLLMGYKNFHFTTSLLVSEPEEDVINFFFQYYQNSRDPLPELIVTPFTGKGNKIFAKAIQTMGTIRVRGIGRQFASLAKLVLEHIQEHQKIRLGRVKEFVRGLEQLGTLLELKKRPVVLEAYDIAVHQGNSPTAARIVFVEGKPDKNEYRYYHLKEREEGNNDFAMMREVIGRRLKGHSPLPDVFVVDGGKGQVGVFVKVLETAGFSIPVVGIAKAPGRAKSEERLILPHGKNSCLLKRYPELLKILIPMRDEAHRFSRKLHHKAEKDRMFSSWLDSVKGIGAQKRRDILRRLDLSPEELAEKNVKEVAELLGVKEETARDVLAKLKGVIKNFRGSRTSP